MEGLSVSKEAKIIKFEAIECPSFGPKLEFNS